MAMSRADLVRLVREGNHLVFSLVGLSFPCIYAHNFEQRQGAIKHLVERIDESSVDTSLLKLHHISTNQFDPNAVLVTMYDGTDIGWIPRNGRFSFAKESRPDLWMLGQLEFAGINELFIGVESECHVLSFKPSSKSYGIVVEAWNKVPPAPKG